MKELHQVVHQHRVLRFRHRLGRVRRARHVLAQHVVVWGGGPFAWPSSGEVLGPGMLKGLKNIMWFGSKKEEVLYRVLLAFLFLTSKGMPSKGPHSLTVPFNLSHGKTTTVTQFPQTDPFDIPPPNQPLFLPYLQEHCIFFSIAALEAKKTQPDGGFSLATRFGQQS